MSDADTLDGLLAPPELDGPALPLTFRQGEIVEFNPVTLENAVRVGRTSILRNLPLLGTAEAATLVVGAIVGLCVAGSVCFILGRSVTPGTAEATNAITQLSQRIVSADVAAIESTTSSSYTDLATVGPEVVITIPASGKVLVLLSAVETSTTATPLMSFAASGANTVAPADFNALSITVSSSAVVTTLGQASRAVLLTGLTPGLTVFTAKYKAVGASTVFFNSRNITVFAL